MASYRKLDSGKWRAEVCCLGIRKSRAFQNKTKARNWATGVEASIHDGSYRAGLVGSKTFGNLLEEYESRVSSKKKGWKKEAIRIKRFCRDDAITKILLRDLSVNVFSQWRDDRLKEVSAGTVNRELNLLSHALNIATDEWGWLSESPIKGLRRPKQTEHRDRLISDSEIERILFSCGYDYDRQPTSVSERVAVVFLFAIETAMRAGEIIKLTWDHVYLDKSTLFIPDSKTDRSREVPLSVEAIRLLGQMPKSDSNGDTCFGITSSQLDSMFRKNRDRCLIENLKFHDTRHEAITRLAKKIQILDLARAVGIRDIKVLMVYYNETAESIAKKL